MTKKPGMEAVLLATGAGAPLDDARGAPAPLATVGDRPMLQHVLETLVGLGVTRYHVVTAEQPHLVEALLGTGERWGCSIQYHLLRDSRRPAAALRRMAFAGVKRVILADATVLPDPAALDTAIESGEATIVSGAPAGAPQALWSVLDPALAAACPTDASTAALSALAREVPHAREIAAHSSLSVRSAEACLAANAAVLDGSFTGLLSTGTERGNGVRVGRNASIDRAARIDGPVFIGEDVRIEAGCVVGPNVVVGTGSIISGGATIRDSVVGPGVFVGEGITLASSLAERDRILDVPRDIGLVLDDELLLSRVALLRVGSLLAALTVRLLAGLALLCALPVIAVTALALRLFRRGSVVFRREVLRLPLTPGDRETVTLWSFDPAYGTPEARSGMERPYRDVLLRVLPGLWHVLRGEMQVVGVQPRPADAVDALPDAWRAVYERGRLGLLTEADVRFGPDATDDEVFAAEGYFAAGLTLRQRLSVIGHYLRRLLVPSLATPPFPTPSSGHVNGVAS